MTKEDENKIRKACKGISNFLYSMNITINFHEDLDKRYMVLGLLKKVVPEDVIVSYNENDNPLESAGVPVRKDFGMFRIEFIQEGRLQYFLITIQPASIYE